MSSAIGGFKTCTKCHETKPEIAFWLRKGGLDSLQSQCKDCRTLAYQEWYKKNGKEYSKKWREKNKKRLHQRQKEYRLSHPRQYKESKERYYYKNHKKSKADARKKRRKYIWKKLKISQEIISERLSQQNNQCAICELPFTKDNRLCIDHDHKLNLFRGLLCTYCNTGLGFFKDNIQFLTGAINYLQAFLETHGASSPS